VERRDGSLEEGGKGVGERSRSLERILAPATRILPPRAGDPRKSNAFEAKEFTDLLIGDGPEWVVSQAARRGR
jgi:hypothetical protein